MKTANPLNIRQVSEFLDDQGITKYMQDRTKEQEEKALKILTIDRKSIVHEENLYELISVSHNGVFIKAGNYRNCVLEETFNQAEYDVFSPTFKL